MRGILVALMMATPSLLLPMQSSHASDILVLLAIIAALLTFAEYSASFPSIVEFRDAPPINRMRFICLMSIVFFLSVVFKHFYDPSNLTALVYNLGKTIGGLADFPYSPVRLLLVMLPNGVSASTYDTVRVAASVAYVISIASVLAFVFAVRVLRWPISSGAFNVWVNLPLFDPTTGGDVVRRLTRDGRINVVLGILLPFALPAIVELSMSVWDPLPLKHPQSKIWIISAWAFLPASILMRGTAMLRIAELIEEKRRRAYANAEALQAA